MCAGVRAQKVCTLSKKEFFMKNMKKLLLLVLSLMLLCGIFAVAALAEEPAQEATVVYPDGSTEVVAVGGTITPKEFQTEGEAKLYYGADNTLFKASGENWVFTVDGVELTDLTVTEDMIGKKIIASGVDKVYFTTKETVSGVATMVYHLTDDLGTYFTSANKGDEGDGIHTGAASYSKLCEKGTVSSLTIKVYSDTTGENFLPTFVKATDNKPLYFDLNGHSLMYKTSGSHLNGVKLFLYSSQPNAHLWAGGSVLVTVNDLATVYFGYDNNSNTNYADNIHFHCKAVYGNTWGSGSSIYGGHFHQIPGTTNKGFVNINRRIYYINNASFYVLDGYSVFHDLSSDSDRKDATTGTNAINKCSFYAQGENAVLYAYGSATTPKFTNCNFYGVKATNAGTAGSVTALDKNDTENPGTNVFNAAITYKTVTFVDGTTAVYVADTLEKAKAFVENHPLFDLGLYEIKDGNELFVVFDPVYTATYDENLNATVMRDGEPTKVYYTLTIGNEVTYILDGTKLNNYLRAMDYCVKITLWENFTVSTNYVGGRKSMEKNSAGTYLATASDTFYKLDLNGYTLEMNTKESRIESHAKSFYIYSSQPGARLLVPNAGTAFYTNNGDYKIIDGKEYGNTSAEYKASSLKEVKPNGNFNLGEETDPGSSKAGPYGKNLTVVCKALTGSLYGDTIRFFGGTYVQTDDSTAATFLNLTNRSVAHYHSTFVIKNPNTKPINLTNSTNRTFYDCTFIYAGGGDPIALGSISTVSNSGVKDVDSHLKYGYTFSGCSFYNILPMTSYTYPYKYTCYKDDNGNGAKDSAEKTVVNTYTGNETLTPTYSGTTHYGFSGLIPTTDLNPAEDAAAYLAHGTSATKTLVADGVTYAFNAVKITDPAAALKITHENYGTDYYVIGATVALVLEEITKIDGTDLLHGAYYDYSGASALIGTDGKVLAAGEAEIPIGYRYRSALAFTYRNLATGVIKGVIYEDCGETAEGVFEKFYELFNAPDAGYEIVMFKDMTVSKGMGFGEYVKHKDTTHNRDYYSSMRLGSIVWDLNGTTVTVAENVSNLIYLHSANCELSKTDPGNETWAGNTVFGFEGVSSSSGNSFTLKSSKAGAKIVNDSPYYLFGIGEGSSSQLIIQGENLTVDAGAGMVIRSYENDYDNNGRSARHQIYGGTYIGANASGVIHVSMNTIIENATLISTAESATRVLALDTYRSGKINAKNCVFVAENAKAAAISATTKYSLVLEGCTFLNVKAPVKSGFSAFTYTGTCIASNASDLALVCPTVPEGMQAVYGSIQVNGTYYRACFYHATEGDFVNVYREATNTTEVWLADAVFVYDVIKDADCMHQKDGEWIFVSDAEWVATLGGAVIENVLAPENVGETVVLTTVGTENKLYFARNVGGEITCYYGDSAQAHSDMVALLQSMGKTSSYITLYSNFSLKFNDMLTANLGGVSHYLDVNGYTLTIDNSHTSYCLLMESGKLYFYSSRDGGVIDATKPEVFISAHKDGMAVLGENAEDGTAYGKNFTLKARCISTGLWGLGYHIVGGTYEVSNTSKYYVIDCGNDVKLKTIKNATFIVTKITNLFSSLNVENATIENCTFICESSANLFNKATKAMTFKNCYFYNVIPTVTEDKATTYVDCYFNTDSDIAQAGGYIAYTGDPKTLTVKGTEYVFGAAFVEKASLIEWGFGLDSEYWAVGAMATHADTVIDTYFLYTFKPFTVAEGENEVVYGLKSIASGIMKMSLTLQSNIGLNLSLSDALDFTALKIGGAPVDMSKLEASKGYYSLTHALAPNLANKSVPVEITIGANVHVLPVNIGSYARQILATAAYSSMHNLTYAMVEYVSAVSGDASFLESVAAPAGYDAIDIVGKDSENTPGSLTAIRFNVSSTIAIEIDGAAAEGKNVNLVLATGRSEHADIVNGSVIFTGLYINEFAGDMKIYVDGEEYTYSLENYYKHLDAATKVKVAALYNYAQYAQAYVDTLPKP